MPSFFNTVKNGYNPDEVDSYIKSQEKALEAYKEKDAAIANAIVNAQIAADNIIRNADLASKSIKQEAIEHLDRISDSLEKQRRLIADFQKEYNDLIGKYLIKIEDSDFSAVLNKVDELENYLERLRKTSETGEADPAEEE